MNRKTVFIATVACLMVSIISLRGVGAPADPRVPAPREPSGRPSEGPKKSDPPAAGQDQQPASPLETAIAFARAVDKNDLQAARDLSVGKPAENELLSALCAAAGAARDLREAATDRFGKSAEALHEVSFADQVLYGREKIVPGADTATVTIGPPTKEGTDKPDPDLKQPKGSVIGLVNVKGQWKVDLATLPQGNDPDAIARVKSRAHAAGATAAELKGGQYSSVREAGAGMEKKIDAAFEAEARLARLNAKARERGGDASSAPINKPTPRKTSAPEPKKEWIGKEKPDVPIRATPTDELLADKPTTVDGGPRVTPLITKDVHDARWSADGKFAMILQEDGVLRKVAVPSLVEERRIALGAKAGDLAVCRSAISVALPATNELVLLDPSTFDVKKRVPVPGIRRITSSAGSTFVFASDAEGQLAVINAVNGETKYTSAAALTEQAAQLLGKPSKKTSSKEASSDAPDVRIGFHLITASPDGTALYCADNLRIHRLRVRNGTLSYEDSSPEVGSDAHELVVSGDGQYVALPIGAGNLELPESPRPAFATYIFRGSDLHKPVLTIDAGPHPQAMAFDPKAHVIYTQNDQHQLIVFSPQGEQQKHYDLIPNARSTTRILADPSGNKLLMLIDRKAVWVELNAASADEK